MWTTSLQADIPVWIMDVELYTPGTPYFSPRTYSCFDNGCGTLQGWDSLLPVSYTHLTLPTRRTV